MCGKNISRILSVLLLCWLLVWPVICSAATMSITEQEMQTLLQNSKRLGEINSYLQLNSTDSQKTLLQVSAELKASLAELQTLKAELAKLQENLLIAKSLSQSQQDLLRKTNESFQQYSNEQKQKINSLRRDRTGWEIVSVILAAVAVIK